MLAELEAQIDQDSAKLVEIGKQKTTYQSEVNSLNSKIAQLNLKIRAITVNLSQLDGEITVNKGQIGEAENKLETNKGALAQLIRRLNQEEDSGLMEVVLKNPKLSDFFGNLNNILAVKDSLSITVGKVTKLREDLLDKKESLADKRSNAAALKAAQDAQKAAADKAKKEKNSLLAETKGQESKFQSILKEKKKTAAEIRNRIFRFLGGGELPFGEAVKLAQVAENATGVRAAFILAILTQESSIKGVIGANLGGCYYDTPRKNVSGSVMKNDQKPAFLALMAQLNMDPKTTPVSCPIASDGAYGGAMGPAQFMPNTWELYKSRVSEITGGNPASPFNNLDAFTGTALYLRDGLNAASCKNYADQNQNTLPRQLLIERCAAARYYAGGNWYAHRLYYGDEVATRANKFQQDIDILNS